jgi:hypothetical protein
MIARALSSSSLTRSLTQQVFRLALGRLDDDGVALDDRVFRPAAHRLAASVEHQCPPIAFAQGDLAIG